MRKSSFGLAMIIAVLLTMVIPAFAVELQQSHRGTDLGDCKGEGDLAVWHFVANQTDGMKGELIIKLPSGDLVGPLTPTKWNKHYTNQHWWIVGEVPDVPEALMTAWSVKKGSWEPGDMITDATQLPGKLVISDAYCDKKD
jgi:hypothetical protein